MTFTDKGILEDNLEKLVRLKRDKKDKHTVILVVGDPGTAKSALSFHMARYLADGPELDWDDLCLTHDQYIESAENGKNRVVWYDEGRDSFYKRRAMTSSNTEALDSLMQHRFRRHIHIINFQNLTDMELDLLYKSADALIRCVKQGWFHVYPEAKIQQIEVDKNTRTVDWPKPSFRDGFDNPERTDKVLWEKYKELNEEKLDEDDSDDDDMGRYEERYTKLKAKLVKTFLTMGLSQSEVAEHLDIAQSNVSQTKDRDNFSNMPPFDMKKVINQADDIDDFNAWTTRVRARWGEENQGNEEDQGAAA